jgi:hypothetical protein
MNDRPLWPEDGMQYDIAMMKAQEEYDAWVTGRKTQKGIRVYSRKELDKEAEM